MILKVCVSEWCFCSGNLLILKIMCPVVFFVLFCIHAGRDNYVLLVLPEHALAKASMLAKMITFVLKTHKIGRASMLTNIQVTPAPMLAKMIGFLLQAHPCWPG